MKFSVKKRKKKKEKNFVRSGRELRDISIQYLSNSSQKLLHPNCTPI